MEYDRHVGMNRKYGAVRIQALKNTPVTVSKFSNLIYFSLNFYKTKVNKSRIGSF